MNKQILNYRSKVLLCDSLVLSQFNYCDAVYGPCLSVESSRRIQVVQNSCLRLIFGLDRKQHISHKLNVIPWLNMEKRRNLHSACLFLKIIHFKTPPYLYNKITFRTDVHNINIRRKDLITIPIHRLSKFQHSFSYCLPSLINRIPLSLKSLSYTKFKKSFRSFLFTSDL